MREALKSVFCNGRDEIGHFRIRIFFFNVAKTNLCGRLSKGQMLNSLYALSLTLSATYDV